MIRQIKIEIPDFIYNWLPVHQRLMKRVKFLQVLMSPFTIMMGEYLAWRDKSITRAYVSCEKLSMEWYLNELYDTDLRRIYIESPDATGVYVALESEGTPTLDVGLESEPTEVSDFVMVPLPYEDVDTGNADFVVWVPVDLVALELAIKKVVINYKLAGMRYVVAYF